MASAAESMRISRQTAHKWWRRYQEAGQAGLEDRSSRPRRCPTKTSAKVERQVVELRRRHQLGAARLAGRAGVPASTLHRIWAAPRGLTPLGPRPTDGPGHPSDRDQPTRRAGPHRREEAGQDPSWRWLAGQGRGTTRPHPERPGWPTSSRLRLRPLRHRRLQPPGLLRGPCRRDRPPRRSGSGGGPGPSSRPTASPWSGC